MRISDIISINLKKLKTRTKKALFLIIPVIALITLSVVVTSQVDNIREALNVSIFDTIAEQYTLLQVKVQQEEFDPSQMFKSSGSVEQNRYSEIDVATVSGIDGVKSADLQSTLPINQVTTNDLFDGKSIKLSNLTTIGEQATELYTENDFTYTEGEPIPIILNASSLVYSYEDWSEGNTIKMETPQMVPGQGRDNAKRISFMKTESIEYDKDDLIGKEFTIAFGGLDAITDYTISRDSGEVTMTKLTDEEMAEKVSDRKTAIKEYWDYTKISTPKTYTFKIVGVIEDESIQANFIPTEFANKVMTDLTSNEISSRKSSDLPNDILNSDFMGLTYNGDEVTQGFGGFMGQIGNRMMINSRERPVGDAANMNQGMSGTNIPGLIVETNDDNEVVGEINDSKIYEKSNKYGDSMSIVVNDISDRSAVIKALNKAGYAYQDLSDLDVFDKLESNLNAISNGLLVSFVILLVVTIIFTMSKYVSESTKEIGIFRAIGMKSNTVLILFILQSILYVTIGYIVGLVLGIGINLIASSGVAIWFENFVEDTVSQSFNVIQTVDSAVFRGINWESVLLYTIVLFVLTLIISIIPAYTASKISPVEAIKNE